MKVDEVQEHEDGSGTYSFEMTDEEQRLFFMVGLQKIIDEDTIVFPENEQPYVPLLQEDGSIKKVKIPEEFFNSVIREEIMNAILKRYRNF